MQTNGPGKYDDACTMARAITGAQGMLLMVIEGYLGTGFSVQADEETLKALPRILEIIAADIRKQTEAIPGDESHL